MVSTKEANASQKSGISKTGRMGGGRGMGGYGIQAIGQKHTDVSSKEEALILLKEQAGELRKQMDDIELKIRSLE